jgi:hypothetical protein
MALINLPFFFQLAFIAACLHVDSVPDVCYMSPEWQLIASQRWRAIEHMASYVAFS